VNIPVELLAVILALAGHTVTVVWWGARVDTRVKQLEDELRELKGVYLSERIAVMESKLTMLLDRLSPTASAAGAAR